MDARVDVSKANSWIICLFIYFVCSCDNWAREINGMLRLAWVGEGTPPQRGGDASWAVVGL